MFVAKDLFNIQSSTMPRLSILAVSCLLFATHAISARITLDCGDIFCVPRIVCAKGSSLTPDMNGKSIVCLYKPDRPHQRTHSGTRKLLSQYRSWRPRPSPKTRLHIFVILPNSRIIEISSTTDHSTRGRLHPSQRPTAVSRVTILETVFHSLMTRKNLHATTLSSRRTKTIALRRRIQRPAKRPTGSAHQAWARDSLNCLAILCCPVISDTSTGHALVGHPAEAALTGRREAIVWTSKYWLCQGMKLLKTMRI